jgi:hypothetical protein
MKFRNSSLLHPNTAYQREEVTPIWILLLRKRKHALLQEIITGKSNGQKKLGHLPRNLQIEYYSLMRSKKFRKTHLAQEFTIQKGSIQCLLSNIRMQVF